MNRNRRDRQKAAREGHAHPVTRDGFGENRCVVCCPPGKAEGVQKVPARPGWRGGLPLNWSPGANAALGGSRSASTLASVALRSEESRLARFRGLARIRAR